MASAAEAVVPPSRSMAFDLSMPRVNHSFFGMATIVDCSAWVPRYGGATMVDQAESGKSPSPYGKRLKQAMEMDGWMPVQLAGELGISKAAIGKLLNGGSNALSAENHVRAARLLRVSSEWLALGEGEPRSQAHTMRDLNGAEWQLVTFFRGIPREEQDHLLQEANNAYSRQHPLPSVANPFGSLTPPAIPGTQNTKEKT